MKRTSLLLSIAVLALVAFTFPSLASAKDAVQGAVTPVVPPTPILKVNGTEYSKGTYAVGTIQLLYTVIGFQFTAGDFGEFRLDMQDVRINTTGQSPSYPVTLTLPQTGSSNLILTPVPDIHSVTAPAGTDYWDGFSMVKISIPSFVPSTPSLNEDGDVLVGNLQLKTPDAGAHLDTVTTVQVHIMLVYPNSCLKLYDYFTDEAFTTIVTSTFVKLGGNPKVVKATNPFGQFSDNILVANTCNGIESFDLLIKLDNHFETNPNNNPGNAVSTFLSGVLTPTAGPITLFGTATAQGQKLCLPNITVPAGSSLLATVHMQLIKGNLPTWLGGTLDPNTGQYTGTFGGFVAELDVAGSTSNCTIPGTLHLLGNPNPAFASMSFTTQ
ncbi:MAG: hypothetical protein A3J28_10520 [Acidobacteria bacterium RIFCSPLOWO2_12_FULL_60_22]|nr:MAG: hypothetical protein A3J28_10520 [Acidobacteria bacterium RIFCSPLOWO2_12_FULL_60_22]